MRITDRDKSLNKRYFQRERYSAKNQAAIAKEGGRPHRGVPQRESFGRVLCEIWQRPTAYERGQRQNQSVSASDSLDYAKANVVSTLVF
jgi:hypothetical protein